MNGPDGDDGDVVEVDLTGYVEPTPPGVKRYRRHYCARRHKSYQTLARCLWPRAAWITGDGPFALVAWCRVPTVTLWPSYAGAIGGWEGEGWATGKQWIDQYGCGGFCRGASGHEVVQIPDPAVAEPGSRERMPRRYQGQRRGRRWRR